MLREVVVASTNEAKIAEIVRIMQGLDVKLLTRSDFHSWPSVAETGDSYHDNALLKAEALVAMTGKLALADDSGIEIDALGGRPGIHSARFAGLDATDDENNALLIQQLRDVPEAERTARYRCVVVLLEPAGQQTSAEGVCEGRIVLEPRGSGGFGYDSYFIPEGYDKTMAELSPDEKHRISHRGKALRSLAEQLKVWAARDSNPEPAD